MDQAALRYQCEIGAVQSSLQLQRTKSTAKIQRQRAFSKRGQRSQVWRQKIPTLVGNIQGALGRNGHHSKLLRKTWQVHGNGKGCMAMAKVAWSAN